MYGYARVGVLMHVNVDMCVLSCTCGSQSLMSDVSLYFLPCLRHSLLAFNQVTKLAAQELLGTAYPNLATLDLLVFHSVTVIL